MTEWISVIDKAPEKGESVLVLRKNGDMEVRHLLGPQYPHESETYNFFSYIKQGFERDVTHWMPLPNSPESKVPVPPDPETGLPMNGLFKALKGVYE